LCPAKTRDFDEIVVVVVVVVVFVLFVDISARIARSLERVWFSCNAPWRLVFDRGGGRGEGGGGGRRGRLFDENKAGDDDDDDDEKEEEDDDDGCRLGGSHSPSCLSLARDQRKTTKVGGPTSRLLSPFVACAYFFIFVFFLSLWPSRRDVA